MRTEKLSMIVLGDKVKPEKIYNTLLRKSSYVVQALYENKIELHDDSGYARWYLSKNFKKI